MTNTHQSLCSARDQRQLINELEWNDPQPATIKALIPNSFTLVFLGAPGSSLQYTVHFKTTRSARKIWS